MGEAIYSLMALKALSHLGPHPFVSVPLNALKKGCRQFEYCEMNPFNATNLLVRDCIFFFLSDLARFHLDLSMTNQEP